MWGCIDWSFGLSARLLITIQIDKPPGTFLAYLALQIFSSLVHSWFLIFQKHLKSGKGTSPKPTLRMISKWYWISIFGQLLVHFLVPCTLFLVPFLQILKVYTTNFFGNLSSCWILNFQFMLSNISCFSMNPLPFSVDQIS